MQRDFIPKGKSLGGTSDLTLLAPIRPGFIDSLETVTHKTRIKRILELLHGARAASHEFALARLLSDSVERVGVIQSVRVCVFEPEDKVMLSVSFDGSWESYIRILWDKVGTLLDLIFWGTEDYVLGAERRYEDWVGWVRKVQVETGFFYGPPDATARDVLFWRGMDRLRLRGAGADGEERERIEVRSALPSAEDAVKRLLERDPPLEGEAAIAFPSDMRLVSERVRGGLQALAALYRLKDLHVSEDDDGVLRRAALQLLLEFVQARDSGLIAALLAAETTRARFARQLDWLFPDARPAALVRQVPPPPAKDYQVPEATRKQVQAGILHGYDAVSHGLVVLLAFDGYEGAQQFFASRGDRITADAAAQGPGQVYRNLSFTPAGLRASGLDEDELDLFPPEFRQGMAARAGMLGDVRNNHPRRWRLPLRFRGASTAPEKGDTIDVDTVHAVLQLRIDASSNAIDYWEDGHPLREELAQLDAIDGVRVLAVQSMKRNFRPSSTPGGSIVEHFGYADGAGQPDVEPAKLRYDRNRIHLGELVHGYQNASDFAPDPKSPRLAWMKDGSFLVVRKYRQFASRMEQAVASCAAEIAKEFGGTAGDYLETVYGKLMGRTRDGLPLTEPQATDPADNRFDYEDDKQGQLCPLHAHIRRAHPRTPPAGAARPPRIMRRGMAYGPPRCADQGGQEADRGLVFMAYNADLGQQFEVVQRWVAGGNSTGASSTAACPILGVAENAAARYFRFEYEGKVFRVELEAAAPLFEDAKPQTQLEWGLYLFAPSIGVIRQLGARAAQRVKQKPKRPAPWDPKRGEQIIAGLQTAAQWKAAIEDPDAIDRLDSASMWAAIRTRPAGVMRAGEYGVLVADRSTAEEVLMNEHGRYSVSGQMKEMKASFGPIYLGLDDGADYHRQATAINEAIGTLGEVEVFEVARAAATAKLDEIKRVAQGAAALVDDHRFDVSFDSREVVEHVVAELCRDWFGLGQDAWFKPGTADWKWKPGEPMLYPGHFTAISRCIFQPNPGPTVQLTARQQGQALRHQMRQFLAQFSAANPPKRPKPRADKEAPVSAAALRHPDNATDPDFAARTVVGVIMGFSPTTIGAVLSVLREWQRDATFAALRSRLAAAGRVDYATAKDIVGPAMQAAARMRPVPQLSWRTATVDHMLGDVPVRKGEKVVIANVSGTQQALEQGGSDHYLMFGGNRQVSPHPLHACPGYSAAIGAMLGTLTALLERQETMLPGLVPLTFTLLGPTGKPGPAPVASPPGPNPGGALQPDGVAKARSVLKVSTRKRIVAWGDSWLDYDGDLRDCLSARYSVPDDFCEWTTWTRLEGMANNPRPFCDFLASEIQVREPVAVLLSGGGNDSTGPALMDMILPRGSGPDVLDRAKRIAHIGRLEAHYRTVLRAIDAVYVDQALERKPPVFVHGYDHPVPTQGGWEWWLWKWFEVKGYQDDPDSRNGAMKELIDEFNKMLANLQGDFPFVRPVNLTGTLSRDLWVNDLHPTREGFQRLARKLEAAISKEVG